MLCYRDRSYCGSDVDTHTCGREITQEEIDHAGEIGLPIAYMDYCSDPKEEEPS